MNKDEAEIYDLLTMNNLLKDWLSMLTTILKYYDHNYGYPWGRLKLLGSTLLMFACWFGALMLVVNVGTELMRVSK